MTRPRGHAGAERGARSDVREGEAWTAAAKRGVARGRSLPERGALGRVMYILDGRWYSAQGLSVGPEGRLW